MSNFKVGQKVVCIIPHNIDERIIKGKIYEIKRLVSCTCGVTVLDFGFQVRCGTGTSCNVCGKFDIEDGKTGIALYGPWRFVPIVNDKSAIKELVENFKEVEERVDVEQPVEI